MIKMKDALKELKEKFDENEFYNLDKEFDDEYVQRFAEDFPESFKTIQKLDTTKKYINLDDYQGDSFACGRIGSLKGWAYQVCEWATMDGYCDVADPDDWMHTGLLPLMNNFNPDTLISYINEIWQINIQEVEE